VRDAETGRGILEFVSIERKDNGGWAIPGVCSDKIYIQNVVGKYTVDMEESLGKIYIGYRNGVWGNRPGTKQILIESDLP
jgi:hypothetical protein